jgi:glycosyltransferase involved in cell wall biosynthesis
MTKRVLLITNFLPDQQASMMKYACMLKHLLSAEYSVTAISPPRFITRLVSSKTSFSFAGYVDKLLIFPVFLIAYSRRFDLIHICDHSNAFYTFVCPRSRTMITCHDVLAIRGAFGDSAAYCKARPLGKLLQHLILGGLSYAKNLIFVSNATLSDYRILSSAAGHQRMSVIYNSQNDDFSRLSTRVEGDSISSFSIDESCYLLMVGSALPRKNREAAFLALTRIRSTLPYLVVLAGEPMSSEQLRLVNTLGIDDKVVTLVSPSHEQLNSLYCHAHALIFCSFSEGFGWPIIEAQACDCPVIASTTTAVPEIVGEGALVCEPHDVDAIAQYVTDLENPAVRDRVVQAGRSNLKRFDRTLIQSQYIDFYRSILTK